MHAPIRRLLVVAAVLTACPLTTAQLISDQTISLDKWSISSGTTTGTNPSVTPIVSTGALQLSGGRHALRFFTDSGTPQAVSAGQFLQVSFDLFFPTTPANLDNGLRVGLFNSGNANRPPVGVGGQLDRQDVFQNYNGYVFGWNLNPQPSTSNKLQLYERKPGLNLQQYTSATRLMHTFNGIYKDPYKGSSPEGQAFASGITYTASYVVTGLNNGSLRFDFSITNSAPGAQNAIQFSDSVVIGTPSTNAFDGFAIFALSGISSFQFDTVRVTFGSVSSDATVSGANVTEPAIPDPSTYSACAGAAVLGQALWRRRRATAKAAVA
jgi:hypothetical protein